MLGDESSKFFVSVQFSSVTQSCPTLCDPKNCSMPGLSVHHQLPETTQTHVHWVGDAIQPSRPLSSPSPPALNLAQRQGLFQWVSSSHHVAEGLEFQLQHQSFQWTPRLISFRMDGLDLLAVLRPPANSWGSYRGLMGWMHVRLLFSHAGRAGQWTQRAHRAVFQPRDRRLPEHRGSPPNFHTRRCTHTKLHQAWWNLGFLHQSEALTSLLRGSEMWLHTRKLLRYADVSASL